MGRFCGYTITKMNSVLSKNIEEVVNNAVTKFIDDIVAKYELSKEDLIALWSGTPQPIEVDKPVEVVKTVEATKKVEIETKVAKKVDAAEAEVEVTKPDEGVQRNVCQHLWMKGARKGTICGCAVSNPLKNYCSKHIAQNKAKEKISSTKSSPQNEGTKKRSPMVLRRNKAIDKIWHPESGMVFVSASDKRVCCKYDGKAMRDLSTEDIELCKELGFAISVPEPEPEPEPESVNTPKVVNPPNSVVDTISEVEKLLGGLQMGGCDSDEETLEEEED